MKLVLVPTPIGNLDDITLRALNVLKSADGILAEDTRTTGQLLRHYGISKPLFAHHAHNEHASVQGVLKMLQEGRQLVLVSDAGTPGISDPGFLLVRECLRKGIAVETLPGPTAFVPALVNSGLPTDRFVFEGFLPHKKGRQTRLRQLSEETRTVVLYESPHRLLKTLEQLAEFLGESRAASVSREISKVFEETVRGSLTEVAGHFHRHPDRLKGEFVICVAGSEA